MMVFSVHVQHHTNHFVPDDELRAHMYNKNPHKMKVRLHTMGVSTDWVPNFKDKD